MAFLRYVVIVVVVVVSCVCVVVDIVFVTFSCVETLYITRCHKSTLSASSAAGATPSDVFGNVVLKFLEYVRRSCVVNYKLLYIYINDRVCVCVRVCTCTTKEKTLCD